MQIEKKKRNFMPVCERLLVVDEINPKSILPMKIILPFGLFLFSFFLSNSIFAQPANDDCASAIALLEVTDWCSDYEAYTNVDATASGFNAATCFSNAGKDVWFYFIATAADVTITIRGDGGAAAGGTLKSPEVALFSGDCSGTISEEKCAIASPGQNVVSLHKGGLQLGQSYLIRVQGKNNNEGTFQLCITNYNPPVEPGQDCVTASSLCDASSFTVQQTSGGGNDNSEANGTCLNFESASTWFTWTAANSAPLTFTLTPTNEPDDLDFVVYELPLNGGCASKITLLCNAAGDSYPSPCMGPTGLQTSSTDATEGAGCAGANDGWLKPLDMVEGKTYALLVNNYSGSGSGFTIDFGGEGVIEGPAIDFETNQPDDKACFGETFVFSDKSTSPSGNIVLWEWNFGLGATPIASTGNGPHTVTYNTPGIKLASLKITSSLGCVLTFVKQIEVLPCCESVNKIEVTPTLTDLKCDGGSDGIIALNVTTNATPVAYNWGDGSPSSPNNSNLEAGEYAVTITNWATCDTVLNFELTAPPPMEFDTLIDRPTCGGGQDGVLGINTTGGVAPYEYSFDGAPFSLSNTLKNVANGLFTVGVRDANGCLTTLSDIKVTELELLLNPNVVSVDTPSCFGYDDGNITLGVLNGLAPYQYNFGMGFGASPILENVKAGTYNVVVLDANLCKGEFEFDINDYPPLTIEVGSTIASCFGLSDGSAFAKAGGGVGNFSYLWSNEVSLDTNANIIGGNYMVTATDGNDCEISQEVIVEQPEEVNVFVTGVEGVVCYGDSTGIVGVDASGGNEPYLFAIDSISSFQQDTAFANVKGGGHHIFVQDASGCIGSDSMTLPQPEELRVIAFGDTTILLGYEFAVGAQVFPQGRKVDYKWFPSDEEFGNDTIPNTRLKPKRTGYYYVQVVDTAGCVGLDSILVQVTLEKPVFGPTAFSPNGDGVNDYFTVFGGPAAIHILSLQIFDRYGDLVYEQKEFPISYESKGWDGRFKGKKMRNDTYVWVATIDFWDGKPVQVVGDVTLIR